MTDRKTTMWAAVLQGQSAIYHDVHHTRRQAINAIRRNLNLPWAWLRKHGWRAVEVTMTWSEP